MLNADTDLSKLDKSRNFFYDKEIKFFNETANLKVF